MGLCWSTVPPEDDQEDIKVRRDGAKPGINAKVGQTQFQAVYKLGGSFSKEEVRLRELLAALRTGLVFSPTEFTVLPGITTTARVRFTLGSSQLSPQAQKTEAEEEDDGEGEEKLEDESEEETDDDRSSDDGEKETRTKLDGPYELKLLLTGESWTKDLTIDLEIEPAVGPFAGCKLVFHWSENMLTVQGSRKGEISVRELPESFETERDFCKCCLFMVHQQNTANHVNEGTERHDNRSRIQDGDSIVLPLTTLAYKMAISNLDAIPDTFVMPAKAYHLFFGSQSPVSLSVRIWPKPCAAEFRANHTMQVKAGILFSEFVHLLREHFQIPSTYSLKLYHNYKPLQMSSTVTAKHKVIDCFVVSYRSSSNAIGGSYTSLNEEEEEGELMDSNANLVISLVGSGMQNILVDLETQMKDFDLLLRSKFNIREDSFLIIRSEDDFAPQYAADDNWKCTYPFSVPDNSFGAGLRRSFRRMSRRRGDNQLLQSQRARSSPNGQESTFSPLMAKVVTLLSSGNRQFPAHSGKYSLSIKELHNSMPMYRMSLDQYGIHPYSIVQVFEVTGPSIPITFRVVSDYSASMATEGASPQTLQESSIIRTRLANIMDINLDWSIDTFLQYVDAIISPASGVRRKRLCFRENYVEDSDDFDLSEQKLGNLLDSWSPTWWHTTEGTKRSQLSIKDIDPAEFLVVEKY